MWPWPAPEDDGGARHLKRSLALPDVALPSTQGADRAIAPGGGLTVVAIYPWTGEAGLANPLGWDTIPGAHGSTAQIEGFRNLHSAFADLDTEIVGVSRQAHDAQRRLADRLGLQFALLCDAQGALTAALGLPTFETGGVTYLKRLTIIARAGRIVRTFYPVHPPDVHAREVLAWITGSGSYAAESRLRGAPRG